MYQLSLSLKKELKPIITFDDAERNLINSLINQMIKNKKMGWSFSALEKNYNLLFSNTDECFKKLAKENNENWEIHYALDQYARSRGVGSRVLESAILLFKKKHVKANLFGRVKIENVLSQKIFRKLGFKEVVSDSLITYYLKLDN